MSTLGSLIQRVRSIEVLDESITFYLRKFPYTSSFFWYIHTRVSKRRNVIIDLHGEILVSRRPEVKLSREDQ